MTMILYLVLSLCLAQLAACERPHSNNFNGGRIVSGELATRGQFPHQVAVFLNNGLAFGAGSLISEKWVLTAGHVVALFQQWTVYLGAQTLSASEPGRVVVDIQNAVVHDGFAFTIADDGMTMTTLSNDIGLLELPEAVIFTEFIKPAALPTLSQENESFLGREVVFSGWGLTSSSNTNASDELMFARATVIGNYECAKSLSTLVSAENICTDGVELVSTCEGDSGGPLALENGDNSYTLIGVISFGSAVQPCDIGLPFGQTRITYYLAWIEDKTGIAILPQ